MFLCLLASLLTAPPMPAAAQETDSGLTVQLEHLGRLHWLAQYRSAAKVAMVSSYDRTGGNDDGFSGRYSALRKEGDALVIADLKGPGVIYRIWTPTPTDQPLEFYFDDEPKPRLVLPFRSLFDGTRPPFVEPLCGFGAGGFTCYLPMPFQKSCRIVYRGPRMQFIQINHAALPAGTRLETFTPDTVPPSALEAAKRLLNPGTDISALCAPPGSRLKTTHRTAKLEPGKTSLLFSQTGGGRIVGIRLSPAAALAGKDRSAVLKITWDDDTKPAVRVPAGDFFGFSWGTPSERSALLGTDGDTCYCYLPMPFSKGARIELVDERASGPAKTLRAEIVTTAAPRTTKEGRFYAVWHREDPTTNGVPFTYVQALGRGHLVGVALQAQGTESGQTLFFEGDDQATIDGELSAHGTGSEDFFNGGWYDVPGRWETRLSLPLSGCLDYQKHLSRTGAYRWFLGDAYSFQRSLLLTMEHGPEKNAMLCDYAATTYLYADQPPAGAGELAAAPLRKVTDLRSLVYTPGWSVPIHAFSFLRGTLTKKEERIDDKSTRYLAFRAEGEDVFGEHLLGLTCEVPASGIYEVSLEAVEGPEQAVVQLFSNEKPMGEKIDLYRPVRARGNIRHLGRLHMKEGPNPVYIKLMGRNSESRGLGLDLVTIRLKKAD